MLATGIAAAEPETNGKPRTKKERAAAAAAAAAAMPRYERVTTTVGRVLLYEIVPPEIPFTELNKTMKKKELGNLIDIVYRRAGDKATVIFADRLKDIGFEFATKAGISISIKDMTIPPQKGASARRRAEAGQRDSAAVQQRRHHRRRALQQGRRYLGRSSGPNRQRRYQGPLDPGLRQERQGRDHHRAVVQPDLHHGRLGRPRFRAADSSARWIARPDGEAVG